MLLITSIFPCWTLAYLQKRPRQMTRKLISAVNTVSDVFQFYFLTDVSDESYEDDLVFLRRRVLSLSMA
jgi:hypothetical protein